MTVSVATLPTVSTDSVSRYFSYQITKKLILNWLILMQVSTKNTYLGTTLGRGDPKLIFVFHFTNLILVMEEILAHLDLPFIVKAALWVLSSAPVINIGHLRSPALFHQEVVGLT